MIGLYDADLMDGGTRHPNLTLMKLSGYFNNLGEESILIKDKYIDTDNYEKIFISKVFSKTELPYFSYDGNVVVGGTGMYTDNPSIPEVKFITMRIKDMNLLTKLYPDYNPGTQMPNYHLYDEYINELINNGKKEEYYKDYKDFSIGFLTRGCIRHCPFCVNRYENGVKRYSHLKDFLNEERKNIYLWDDNIMAAPEKLFNECMDELIECGKPFQFKQGLDLRLMNDDKANRLLSSKYYGDFIFAFDKWEDREWIEKKLQLWREHTNKSTKLYLFCGFKQAGGREEFYNDILILFKRIEILMRHHCLGYVMRHANYMNSYMPNMYVQIARWCNQPAFYKKTSFREFIDATQKTVKTKECIAVKTFNLFCKEFSEKMDEIGPYLDMKYENFK